jgi:osmoprotectant transport system permease protein
MPPQFHADESGDNLPVLSPIAAAVSLRCVVLATALLGLYGAAWLSIAANRLLPGASVGALTVLGPWTHVVAVLVALAAALGSTTSADGMRRAAAFVLLLTMMISIVILTGLGAGELMQGRPPAARAMVGASFWIALASLTVLLFDDARGLSAGRIWACAALALGTLAAARRAGVFDALSLFIEFQARAEAFQAATLRHLALSAAALLLAFAASLPLGWLAFRSRRIKSGVDAALNAIQVIPAVALFGILVSLLSLALAAWPSLRRLGLAGIGPTPALIGIACYLALPLTRSITAGFLSPDPSVIEAARAMGMTTRRIAWEVRLPLGLPVFVGGLRVALVQSIGLMTLGGLIGAGGLGAIVFEGMAQFASDLIILGSAPIVGLAILADATLKAAERLVGRPLS